MELSCRVFLVSYPSSKQQRTVDPEPANSARFRSAKPSCSQENNGGEGERTKKQNKKHFNKGIYSVTQSRGGQHRRELGQKHKPQTQRWGADPLELGVGGCLPHPQPGERSAGHQPRAREEKSSGAGQDSVNQPAAVA